MTRPDPSKATWRKSSHSDSYSQDCVEVAQVDRLVAVRDSRDPDGPVLTFAPSTWRGFLTEIKTSALT
jgi:hypothetical protein